MESKGISPQNRCRRSAACRCALYGRDCARPVVAQPGQHRSRRRRLLAQSLCGQYFAAPGCVGLDHGTTDRCRLREARLSRRARRVLADERHAAAVQFAQRRPFSRRRVPHQAPNLQNIGEMDAPDEHTVVLTLKKVDANALEDINSRVIMKQSVAEKMGEADNKPVGTGPFKFTSWERSGQFVLRRNDAYWGKAPRIDAVIYKSI